MLPSSSYVEKVYAGVLGKLIGVYLGRPFEGWDHQKIIAKFGEIRYFVNERLQVPLIVADDDISGTFTFLRALQDHPGGVSLSAEQIGKTWLNYIIENRSILWWGGFGNSTEHTAYLRLKAGIKAPTSGSAELNGRTVAEQIGAQIFIDGWSLVAPGNPSLAVTLAGRAASVSHDGEAIYAAQFLAAMESAAFVEGSLDRLIETALAFIPPRSLISRLIEQVREWSRVYQDWRDCRQQIERNYGYDQFPGNCHVVPNHAVILLSLLYAENDFGRALMIANTAGWDTDCNSGNVGCLLGIKNGLAAIEQRWREPVADRLYLATADGGRGVTDAVRESYEIAKIAASLNQVEPIGCPKGGARFHFQLPGSVQGFLIENEPASSAQLVNRLLPRTVDSRRALAIDFQNQELDQPIRVETPTFIQPDSIEGSHYLLMACPTLFSSQVVNGRLLADPGNSALVTVVPEVAYYGENDELFREYGPGLSLSAGELRDFSWTIPEVDALPIARFGLEIRSSSSSSHASIYVDFIDWSGTPTTSFRRPRLENKMWRRAWVNAFDHLGSRWASAFHLSQDRGTGLLIQGTRDWRDYVLESSIVADPAKSFGLAGRVQGLRRYYALLLGPGPVLRLVRNYDGIEELAATPFSWSWHQTYHFRLQLHGSSISGSIDGQELLQHHDESELLLDGGIALLGEEGLIMTDQVKVSGIV